MVKLRRIYWSVLIVWGIVLVANWGLFAYMNSYEYTMLVEAILFSLQSLGLLLVNAQLHWTISEIFEQEYFTRERRFLKCTLIAFTMSYFVVVIRSTTIYLMIRSDNFPAEEWVCKNNFIVNFINVVSYTFIDLIPICTIFYLHWQNFRKEAEKEYMLEKQMSGYGAGNRLSDY